MIGRLNGILVEKQPPEILLEVSGVGYEVNMPMTCFYDLPNIGENAIVYTHFVVREDAQLLFGFNNKIERALFRELLKANGVGPKLGLAILSGMSAKQFVSCVNNEDATSLVKLPGVGKKTAERLVLEMKDRLKDWGNDLFTPFSDNAVIEPASDALIANNAADDAISALVSLGYKLAQAQKTVKSVAKPGMSTEVLIKESLKSML
ncbi:Holliday junction branch migration protein RuvA [Pseudoalteromonas sp. SR44-5]|jgi:Holliday junction DNA helicase RuvA|uniref:Holliday junction branch migration complex subunit RuvA n=1 Tax=Pseudoalteromonas neustonica TaxID=1840331 RepID=A0ABY3FIT8_9GAMM|nr:MULTISPECIES: Holliday junction branch migration protein RuvA [Pseudoalteromonas]MBB1291704.1 Holliday junction branch migration protein RuvA [Pseudoalteromonas sp. SR41-4]MBB1299871.1 Holliday junction branch migration protein RuvA [Pseudoalteromonas sp. SR44-8]MBB1308521.1 Holliday junction branch migration protein RuvA [Pseudoalteromonas sp. SR41-8]MBB1333558.1 Holliday junction branch migration protein RuvA [Pseudoalteromonas sp. SR41-6]MBB1341518.1 Holliday junction branch migration pr|tara:strand:+ start:4732 stop:5349 length:618 start_codon:yes stop_codon:yes gene_type:complete